MSESFPAACAWRPCLGLFCLLCASLFSSTLPAAAIPDLSPTTSISSSEAPTRQKPRAPRLSLEAILGKRAVINLNGQRTTLAVGETSRGGVRLLSLDDGRATVEFAGKRRQLRLGQAPINTRFEQPETVSVSVMPNAQGMYITSGAINGQGVRFLVDTGATTVAMNANEARRLGVDFRLRGRPIRVNTASGQSRAYLVTLREVSVGGIRANNVEAVVLEGDFPQQILLGMSFLGGVHIRRNGLLLELQQKY